MKFFITLLCLSHLSAAHSLDPAESIVAEFSKLRKPDSSADHFEQWIYNVSGFTATHCWRTLKKDSSLPKALESFKPLNAGKWTLPDEKITRKLCHSVASNGINPVCTDSNYWAKGVRRNLDIPLMYVQVYKNEPLEIKGTLTCYLNNDKVKKQIYSGPLKASWIDKPEPKKIKLTTGDTHFEVGTLLITSPNARGENGLTFEERKPGILIPKDQ